MTAAFGKRAGGLIACGLLVTSIACAWADEGDEAGQWSMGGQDVHNWRHQEDTGINQKTVGGLKLKWTFTTGGDVSATPAVVDGVVYFPDFAGNFYAVNAKTGTLVWQQKVANWSGVAGDYARNDPVIYRGLVIVGSQAGNNAFWNGSRFVGNGAWVMAADAETGAPRWKTQVEAFPGAMVTSSPVVYKGMIYVGVASAEEGAAAVLGTPC